MCYWSLERIYIMPESFSEKLQTGTSIVQGVRPKRQAYVRTDVIIVLTMIVLLLLPAWQSSNVLVKQGLEVNGLPIGTLQHFFFALAATVVLLLLMVSRFFVQFRRANTFQLTLKFLLIAAGIIVIAAPFVWMGLRMPKERLPNYVPFTFGFLQRMQENADLEAMRTWLETDGKKFGVGPSVEKTEYPEAVRALAPKYVWVKEDKQNNQRSVSLEWGGALAGHWGLTVGPTSMRCPPCDLGMDGEYRLPLTDGAYVWFDLH